MTPNEFEKKLKEINPNLNVIFRDNKKATAVVILDDSSGEDIIQRPVFNLEYRTWDAMASTLLTVSERSRLNALLLEAMAYIKGPDLFVAVDNGERPIDIPINPFREYTNYLADILNQKNLAYGDSFGKSLDEDGLLVLKIRLGDKLNRVSSLIKRGELKENDESLEDTLLDMAGYAVLGLKYLEEHENE